MRELRPGDCRKRRSRGDGVGRFHLDLQMLAMQTQARSPLVSSGPVSPEERSRAYWQRMEQHAHLTRFSRCVAIPLALLAQRTRTATADAGPIDDAQASIGFSAVFMR